jgi:hypothetical protein
VNRNFEPQYDITNWSETRWVGSWNPDARVGLYVHAGRCRGDLGLWWVQMVAYLPGGELVVDRSFHRGLAEPGEPGSGLWLRPDDDASDWSAAFDGAGEVTTTAKLAARTRGSGPTTPIRWHLDGKAASPPYSPLHGSAEDQASFAAHHMQRMAQVRGTMTVAGRTYALDGIGFTDHSSGPRTFTDHSGHLFINAIMPTESIYAMTLYNMDGTTKFSGGSVFVGDDETSVAKVTAPPPSDLHGAPEEFDLDVTDSAGDSRTFRVAVLGSAPLTMTNDNQNLIGIDWEVVEDTLVLTECLVRLTDADGNVGYGHLERAARRRDFTSSTT